MIVTMDGNFGQVRKRSSGRSLEEPKHLGRMFIPDSLLADVIASSENESKLGEGVCGLPW